MSSSDRGPDLDVLEGIQRRVLWPAVRIVDAANRRGTGDGVKAEATKPRAPVVDAFGQGGSVHELHVLLPGSIVNAALAALSLR